jgi:Tol biopolymer transport system component
MTFEQRFERDLPLILDDIAMGTYPDYIDGVLVTTATRRQRPRWTFPERWLPMDIVTTRVPAARLPMRQLGVLALIAALLAAAIAVYVGSQQQKLPPAFGPAANGDLILSVDGDIVRLDPVTGHSQSIVTGSDVDSFAKVSPDGQRIAFFRRSTEGHTTAAIVVAAIDGSNPHTLVEPLERGFDMIAWAPDSRSLLVDTAASREIWRYDTQGTTAPQLVASEADAYASPFQPPAGSSILIYRNNGLPHLSTLDLTTSKETVLADGLTDQDFDDVRWSPDGTQVAYHAAPADDLGSQRLFVIPADGKGEPRQITDAPGTWWDIDQTWSPDGTSIAFDRYQRVGIDWLIRPLAIVDVATEEVREVGPIAHDARAQLGSPTDSAASPGEGMWFEWSPDGKFLLAVPTEAPAHPVLIDVSTGAWRNLEPLIAPDFVDQSWQRVAE